MGTIGYRPIVNTMRSPRSRQLRVPLPGGRRAVMTMVSAIIIPAALSLSGCGQSFSQDGGILPVPQASTEGLRSATPAPAPAAPNEIIGPGYAPPRTSGPTQTAVPNLPGGKL